MLSTADHSALETLRRKDASMAEVMGALNHLDKSDHAFSPMKAGIAANITVDLLSTYLRRHAYLSGIRLQVAGSSYDNVVSDTRSHAENAVDLLIIVTFFDNLQPSWEAQLENLGVSERQAIHTDYLGRLELALQAARQTPQVLLLGAHLFSPEVSRNSPQRQALDGFNEALSGLASRHAQVRFVETEDLLANAGALNAFDPRFYARGKAPYTADFLNRLTRRIAHVTRSFGSCFHKVLILDCDNTLWGGIVGEDGIEGIKLDPYSFPGCIFWNVQHQIKALESQGVLLCLCSKNNPADVDQVLADHPSMVLREENLVIKKVNWNNKPASIQALSDELNLGLDSFVFLDDSSFEVEAVREQLPQVRVFQVPKSLHEYPALLRNEIAPLFVAGGVAGESRNKTQQYRELLKSANLQNQFSNHEDYLRSLQLSVHLQRDSVSSAERITELIGKSNQFNLTTQRLTQGEVRTLMERDDATVYSFSVSDRFAEHGLTGVIITIDDQDTVFVHSFLMSCRIIGRGVEFAVWKGILRDAATRGKKRLAACYRPSAKNVQVEDFYDRLGLTMTSKTDDGSRHYEAELSKLKLAESAWVELLDA